MGFLENLPQKCESVFRKSGVSCISKVQIPVDGCTVKELIGFALLAIVCIGAIFWPTGYTGGGKSGAD